MKEKLLSFFSEDSGLSSNRLATVGSIVLFIPCFVVQWTWLSASKGQMQEIPESVMWFLGVLLGGKVVQKGIEVVGQILNKPTENTPL